jgi:hypothetical protein
MIVQENLEEGKVARLEICDGDGSPLPDNESSKARGNAQLSQRLKQLRGLAVRRTQRRENIYDLMRRPSPNAKATSSAA